MVGKKCVECRGKRHFANADLNGDFPETRYATNLRFAGASIKSRAVWKLETRVAVINHKSVCVSSRVFIRLHRRNLQAARRNLPPAQIFPSRCQTAGAVFLLIGDKLCHGSSFCVKTISSPLMTVSISSGSASASCFSMVTSYIKTESSETSFYDSLNQIFSSNKKAATTSRNAAADDASFFHF